MNLDFCPVLRYSLHVIQCRGHREAYLKMGNWKNKGTSRLALEKIKRDTLERYGHNYSIAWSQMTREADAYVAIENWKPANIPKSEIPKIKAIASKYAITAI